MVVVGQQPQPYTSNQAQLTALAGCTTATGAILAWTGRSSMQLLRNVPGNTASGLTQAHRPSGPRSTDTPVGRGGSS
jgi:hypothetical protein